MTNQEAIETIKLAQSQIEWDYPMDYSVAFDMAIAALQAQPDLQPTCNNLATDFIGRQAEIDTEGLDEEIRCEMCRNQMKTDRGCDGNCKYDEKLYEKITQILYERIKLLPSTQPEIVRCKDCVHWSCDGSYDLKPWCRLHEDYMVSSDFCSNAERRDE